MFRTALVRILSLVLVAGTLVSQPSAPRFDVASVRPNRSAACRGRWDLQAVRGTVTAENAPLLRIISRAYGLSDDRVSGPSWLDSECYDIRAKAPAGTPDRDLMPMLRTLLAERFHLVARSEPEERQVLVLTIDKGGSKLRPFGEKFASPPSGDGRVLFLARHIPDLCERLGKVTGRPVVDRTGLTGDYQIELLYLPAGAPEVEPVDPEYDIFAAVRNQLGLRLETQRAAIDVLKIQSVDKVPSAN